MKVVCLKIALLTLGREDQTCPRRNFLNDVRNNCL